MCNLTQGRTTLEAHIFTSGDNLSIDTRTLKHEPDAIGSRYLNMVERSKYLKLGRKRPRNGSSAGHAILSPKQNDPHPSQRMTVFSPSQRPTRRPTPSRLAIRATPPCKSFTGPMTLGLGSIRRAEDETLGLQTIFSQGG